MDTAARIGATAQRIALSIVIVNWNSGALLRRCLDSLAPASESSVKGKTQSANLSYEVLVVDNASTDDSIAQARQSQQHFRLIRMPTNVGFARANNAALREATGDVMLLLNPDTDPRPGSIAEMVAAFERHPRAGIVGPKLLNPGGSPQPSVWRFPSLGVLALTVTRVARLLPTLRVIRRYEMRDNMPEQEQAVDQVMGAAFAVRRKTLTAVGPLDEGFWIWFEEVDLCRRARAAGWETWYIPSAEVLHHRAASFTQVSALTRAWWYARSAVRYARKHLGASSALALLMLTPIGLLTAVPAALFGVRPSVAGSKSATRGSGARLGGAGTLAMLGVGAISLFLGLFYSAQAGLLFLAGAWLAVLSWRFPWSALLGLLAAAPWLLILKATDVLGAVTVLKDVIILTLLARTLRGGGPWPQRAILAPTVFLALWSVVAFLGADGKTLGLLRLRDVLLYIPLLLIVPRLAHTEARQRALLAVFLASGALVLLLGAAQLLWFPESAVLREVRVTPEQSVWVPRLSSVLAHPNILGGYLLFLVPLSAALAAERVRKLWPLGALLALGGLAATAAAYSRSAWIAMTVALAGGGVVFVAARRTRLVAVALLAGVMAAAALWQVPRVQNVLRTAVDPTYESNRERIEFFTGVLADLSAGGAVFGEGLGDTARLLGRSSDITLYQIASAGARDVQRAKARTFLDNAVAKTWVEQGIVGLVLAGWVAARLLAASVRQARRGSAPHARAIGLATASTVLGLAALWLFLDVPDIFPVNLYFWTFAGMVSIRHAAQGEASLGRDPSVARAPSG